MKRLLLALLTCLPLLPAVDDDAIRSAMVKIFVVSKPPNWHQPWSAIPPQQGSGSGCLIGPGRILTNAHVVTNAAFVQVRLAGQANKVTARIVSVAHDADLALLQVDQPGFAAGIAPLELGELPRTQDEVVVYGFPMGGDMLSTTRGVVSRIEHRTYAHSGTWQLAIQVDAAINPGNSGGPAISGGKVVGVAMQGLGSSQNIGYLVPPPVIRHVQQDLADGRYDGFPTLDLTTCDLESPALKTRFGAEGRSGVVVTRLHPASSAQGILRPGDVILTAGGRPLGDDGTLEFRKGERSDWALAVQEHQLGENVKLGILRDGAEQELAIPLRHRSEDNQRICYDLFDEQPRYFIHAGLVFIPVTRNYLRVWGSEWWARAPKHLTVLLEDPALREADPEPVVLSQVLAHEVNVGYHNARNWRVEAVDGQAVRSLADLVRLVEAPGEGRFLELRNHFGGVIVLDRAAAKAAHPGILALYQVGKDRQLEP